MTKMFLALFLTFGIAATAAAHHNSNNDNAGGNMNQNSGHLELVF